MKLAHASSWSTSIGLTPYGDADPVLAIVPGLVSGAAWQTNAPSNYYQEIDQCRYFYRYDPIASTVINRMADMAISEIRNRRRRCSDEEVRYFDAVAKSLDSILQAAALEYLVTGMAVPEYTITRIMGSRIHPDLGRTRYAFPANVWIRNPDNIRLRRVPGTMNRAVYLKVPAEEVTFIVENGKLPDGTFDRETYALLEQQFPEYVAKIKSGQTEIKLEDAKPILRKPMSHMDFPQPFLVPALASLKHKLRIKQLDHSIASRAIEAIRLIKAGSDEFPVTEDDPQLNDLKAQMSAQKSVMNNELIYSLFANHTVTIEWVYPPLDALLSDVKYNEPNADIFMAMGFSRTLLVGESLRSNAGGSISSTAGPVATLNELRRALLSWVTDLYKFLAEKNGFKTIPEPVFHPIAMGELAALAQFAIEASKIGVLSRDTVARIFNSDFETEYQQAEAEVKAAGDSYFDLSVKTPADISKKSENRAQQQQDHTIEMSNKQFDAQQEQQQVSNDLAEKSLKQKSSGGNNAKS